MSYSHVTTCNFWICSPLPQSNNKSIDRDAFIYTYEPIEHDTHTTNEEEGEEWSDNLAYGKVGSNGDEIDEHQPSQCGDVYELQGNDSYNPVPSISAQEEWTDNLAYGKVDSQDEVADHQFQHETVVELQGNKSYNSVPSISAQDEGEYSYAAFSVESPAQLD